MQDFELTDQAGQARRLTDALQDGTVVVISYRGDWVVIPPTRWCSTERAIRLDAIFRW